MHNMKKWLVTSLVQCSVANLDEMIKSFSSTSVSTLIAAFELLRLSLFS